MHQGINVQNDLFINVYCERIIRHSVFKLGGSLENSYGFIFIGPVSMETLLTAESVIFVKITRILSTPHYVFFLVGFKNCFESPFMCRVLHTRTAGNFALPYIFLNKTNIFTENVSSPTECTGKG